MAVRELETAPNLLALYGRSVLTGLRGGSTLPDAELVLRGVHVDRDHLADYDRVCGFVLSDRLPASYLHVRAFPLAVQLMSAPSFPFPLPGMVHIANRIDHRRPVLADESVDLSVRAADLRPHPKGQQLDVVARATVGGELVWEDVSTYLHRGAGASDAVPPGPALDEPAAGDGDPRWRVGADAGRRYAAVSGDRNPIHLHPLTARLFGFPRAIAHGMWTAARVLAALEGRLPSAFRYEVAFKRPLLLPSTVRLAVQERPGGHVAVAIRGARSGEPHLVGAVTPPG